MSEFDRGPKTDGLKSGSKISTEGALDRAQRLLGEQAPTLTKSEALNRGTTTVSPPNFADMGHVERSGRFLKALGLGNIEGIEMKYPLEQIEVSLRLPRPINHTEIAGAFSDQIKLAEAFYKVEAA